MTTTNDLDINYGKANPFSDSYNNSYLRKKF